MRQYVLTLSVYLVMAYVVGELLTPYVAPYLRESGR